MNDGLKVTLDLAQIVMVGGLIWGLAQMSGSVRALREATTKLTERLDNFGTQLVNIVSRIAFLEGRSK